jgi:dTDP-4-dehydrorhamnose 3,5-epimerase
MKINSLSLEGVRLIVPEVFDDDRGYFFEIWSARRYAGASVTENFVQDNVSKSVSGVLRGLHYQYPNCQAKLVHVLQGEVFDVVVDIRRGSPTFARWVGVRLSDKNKFQLFIPAGFAHGFCTLSETAIFCYKCSDYYDPESERGIHWKDEAIGINWPVTLPILSKKDQAHKKLGELSVQVLPAFSQ